MESDAHSIRQLFHQVLLSTQIQCRMLGKLIQRYSKDFQAWDIAPKSSTLTQIWMFMFFHTCFLYFSCPEMIWRHYLLASNLFREICFTTFEMMIKSSHIIPSYSSDPDNLHRFTQRFRRWSLQERGVSLLPARLRHADRAALDHHEGVVRGVDGSGESLVLRPFMAVPHGWMDHGGKSYL